MIKKHLFWYYFILYTIPVLINAITVDDLSVRNNATIDGNLVVKKAVKATKFIGRNIRARRGKRGVRGTAGPTGLRGPEGHQGPTGVTGATGPQCMFPCDRLKRILRFSFNSSAEEILAQVEPPIEHFIAEGRAGDTGSLNIITYEQDIQVPPTTTPVLVNNNQWISGVPKHFELAYEAATGTVTWRLGSITQTHTIDPDIIGNIIILRLQGETSSAVPHRQSDMVVSNITIRNLDGSHVLWNVLPQFGAGISFNRSVELLRFEIPPALITDGIRITGEARIIWFEIHHATLKQHFK